MTSQIIYLNFFQIPNSNELENVYVQILILLYLIESLLFSKCTYSDHKRTCLYKKIFFDERDQSSLLAKSPVPLY